jgi:peroxin-7
VKINKNHIQQATFIIAMMEFLTAGYNGYAVKYSPFVNDRLAVATSANFGLVGNGRLYILGLTANGIVLLRQ